MKKNTNSITLTQLLEAALTQNTSIKTVLHDIEVLQKLVKIVRMKKGAK